MALILSQNYHRWVHDTHEYLKDLHYYVTWELPAGLRNTFRFMKALYYLTLGILLLRLFTP